MKGCKREKRDEKEKRREKREKEREKVIYFWAHKKSVMKNARNRVWDYRFASAEGEAGGAGGGGVERRLRGGNGGEERWISLGGERREEVGRGVERKLGGESEGVVRYRDGEQEGRKGRKKWEEEEELREDWKGKTKE